jgi:hypothetical protein
MRILKQVSRIIRQGVSVPDALDRPQFRWDDLRFPATAVNPPGLASDPDFDTDNGGWLFAAAGTELIFLAAQMPHAWREGADIFPHVHWQKTTSAAGNVLWRFSYKWAPINTVMDASFTDVDASTTVSGTPDTDEADKHLITSFSAMNCSGKELSDMLMIKLQRVGGDAADTYGADARLLEFDIHYELDDWGSHLEFTK